jgi:hypothetical protein
MPSIVTLNHLTNLCLQNSLYLISLGLPKLDLFMVEYSSDKISASGNIPCNVMTVVKHGLCLFITMLRGMTDTRMSSQSEIESYANDHSQ